MRRFSGKLKTALKFGFSLLLLFFIFYKIDFSDLTNTLKEIHVFFLIPSFAFYLLSQLVSAQRLNLYFHQLEINLSYGSNLKLYLLGMFYNLFLPGGIGGDAYKIYALRRQYQVKLSKLTSGLILDRLSGLSALLIYACLLMFLIDYPLVEGIKIVLLVVPLFGLGLFWLINQRFFGTFLPVFWKSTAYSFLVQCLQLISTAIIVFALGAQSQIWLLLTLFLISSVVSTIPLTVGGIGSRELTFYYGAQWFNIDMNIALSVSLTFFILTAVASMLGLPYHFKQIRLEATEAAGD